ncbi:MAG: very short patch repair endonuclease [Candidatus Yanofskybacteria bacterium]|nr:very short patch repair endonuclease [Candidatus Yanofskybacteria bacterium]
MKKYIRDGRAPIPRKLSTSKVMSANKKSNTGPEIILKKYIRKAGLRGYRLSPKNIPGRPDISFTKKKIAIFVHGCFWHRCPECSFPLPRDNKNFWSEKFKRNKARDQKKKKELQKLWWKVLTIWEHQIKDNPERAARFVAQSLLRRHDVA